jgi:type I restriction enzyme S subunit
VTRSASLALLGSARKITPAGLKHSSAKLLPPNTILMSSRASIGYFGLYDQPACTNQGFISMIPHDERYRYYLLHNLIGRKDEIISHAGGTTYKEINKTTFRALPIVLPSPQVAADFNGFTGDIMGEVRLLARQSERLAAARDLLLPRLMSGEIVP